MVSSKPETMKFHRVSVSLSLNSTSISSSTTENPAVVGESLHEGFGYVASLRGTMSNCNTPIWSAPGE